MLSFIKRRRSSAKNQDGASGKSKAKGIIKKRIVTTTDKAKSPLERNHSNLSGSGHTGATCTSEELSLEFSKYGHVGDEDQLTVSDRTQSTVCTSSSHSSFDSAPQLPQRSTSDRNNLAADVAVDYGYGDATPEDNSTNNRDGRPIRRASIQYNDQSPSNGDNKYGYGDAQPDSSMYGYGDASPDTSKYGYGDASPDTSRYGYGDAAPDSSASRYQYEDASVDSDCAPRAPARRSSMTAAVGSGRQPRRSSMKTSGAPRRSSIGYTGEREVVLPGRRQVKRRTSISFDEQVKVRSVAPVAELAKNPEKLWFQAEDYEKMRQKSITLAEMVERRGVDGFPGRVPCIRGLECLIGDEGEAKSVRRYDAYGVVMYEQHSQRNEGVFYDDEAMSKLYEETTEQYENHEKLLEEQKPCKTSQNGGLWTDHDIGISNGAWR